MVFFGGVVLGDKSENHVSVCESHVSSTWKSCEHIICGSHVSTGVIEILSFMCM